MIKSGNIIYWDDILDVMKTAIKNNYDNINTLPNIPRTTTTTVYDTGWTWCPTYRGHYDGGWVWGGNKKRRGEYIHEQRKYVVRTSTINVPSGIVSVSETQFFDLLYFILKHSPINIYYVNDNIPIADRGERHSTLNPDYTINKAVAIRTSDLYYLVQLVRLWLGDITYVLCYATRPKALILCKLLTESEIRLKNYYNLSSSKASIISEDYKDIKNSDEMKTYINTVIANVFNKICKDDNRIFYESLSYTARRLEISHGK